MPRGLVRVMLTAVSILLALGGPLAAGAGSPWAMDVRGRWRPWKAPTVNSLARLPAAERQAFAAALTRLAEPFRRVPPLNPPMGFEVAPYRAIEGGRPIRGVMWLAWYPYLRSCSTCPHSVYSDFLASFLLYVNDVEALFEVPHDKVAADESGTLYREPRRLADLAGFPRYEQGVRNTAVVITRRPAPILVPVSQARVIRARIREVAQEAARYERARDEWRARAARERQRALEAELAALSPPERAAPAYCCYGSSRPSGLSAPDDPQARRVVAVNPALFDRAAPPQAFQLLIVEGRPPRNPDDPLRPAFDAVWATVDWRAFLAMLAGG
ncbi:MAG: hypothetical protein QN158_11895 [Armatimonadota bacterium]|nr:hypothetical protein [Armatimonadota bacterium]MDR7586271.1 hypothetical protein [Armatimonadota bacterium]